jgi:HSP20 family protein
MSEHPLERLHRDFETLFNRMWSGWMMPFDQDFASMPIFDLNVTENDQQISVRAELPGFEQNEIDVRLTDNVLTIKAEKEKKVDGREEHRTFYRTITLPTGIDADKVQATYRNGVLELNIPRAETARPRRIEIQGHQRGAGQQKGQRQAVSNQTGSTHTGTASEKTSEKTKK